MYIPILHSLIGVMSKKESLLVQAFPLVFPQVRQYNTVTTKTKVKKKIWAQLNYWDNVWNCYILKEDVFIKKKYHVKRLLKYLSKEIINFVKNINSFDFIF